MLKHPLSYQDVPILSRLQSAWTRGDAHVVGRWNAHLYASRESAELQQEDRHLGAALVRLLADLGFAEATAWRTRHAVCFATPFALAASRWKLPVDVCATGYLWAWTENQVAAAIKVIPLGQTAGQRLLGDAIVEIPAAIQCGLAVADEDIGFAAPGLGIVSALHESQYSRLFRS
jgi:urease accessory protein